MPGEVSFKTGHGRVFFQASPTPGGSPLYVGQARLEGMDASRGDITAVTGASRVMYDSFENVDSIRGEAPLPTTSLVMRLGLSNLILETVCPFLLQAHYGKCEDPTDFNNGWDFILAFEHGEFTTISSDTLVAMEQADNAMVTLTGGVSAWRIWDVKKMTVSERGSTEVLREVVAVASGDYVSCGDCGYESDGNQRVLAVTEGSGAGSPGLPAELLVSYDRGVTIDQYDITTLTSSEDPSDLAVTGEKILVPSNDSDSMHVSTLSDPATWVEVTTGFVANKGPNAIFALSPTEVWLCGDGGYIYFSDAPNSEVEVQEAGAQTVQNLNDIHGCNSRDLLCVGDAGTVLYTTNGGEAWTLAPTSPTLDNLLCCWMRSANVWIVGDDAGNLWYTLNGGEDWVEKAHPNSGTGAVRSIAFCNTASSPFGFIGGDDGSKGYMMRSLDCGSSWYELPDGPGTIPACDRINSVATGYGANFVVGGGLADDATDGILIVGVA